MPQGTDPPDLGLPEAIFNALKQMDYHAGYKAFRDGQTYYRLFAEKDPSAQDKVRWFHGTAGEGSGFPMGEVPQITYDVISGGNYQTDGTVKYQGDKYRIRLMRNAYGDQIAEANKI